MIDILINKQGDIQIFSYNTNDECH